jgi:hypothetical protein
VQSRKKKTINLGSNKAKLLTLLHAHIAKYMTACCEIELGRLTFRIDRTHVTTIAMHPAAGHYDAIVGQF